MQGHVSRLEEGLLEVADKFNQCSRSGLHNLLGTNGRVTVAQYNSDGCNKHPSVE